MAPSQQRPPTAVKSAPVTLSRTALRRTSTPRATGCEAGMAIEQYHAREMTIASATTVMSNQIGACVRTISAKMLP
ncbi:hypothetical protein F4827_005566 [Paraburkholderia bannensis]|uniref:Uncharacterized protein n=1 Tax=Paraburkholderia bannensis TaxID=765414 RepID=A0A7W9U3R9_9BURK|nr:MULTISPECIES: hypothetical protein [Paraburkholderia]MBB3260791.1 hypothetical protein [Paraburkholderia sp. WP4_3_2]MBB6105696.1 hypothetical protein [Paraburkholderia bannensis]